MSPPPVPAEAATPQPQSAPLVIEYIHTAGEAVRANSAVTRKRVLLVSCIYAAIGIVILGVGTINPQNFRFQPDTFVLTVGLTHLSWVDVSRSERAIELIREAIVR